MTSEQTFFSCTQCGDCCKGFGGTYLTGEDMAVIADHLDITPDEFQQEYCTPSGGRLVLSQRQDGYCIFWDRICTIHDIKPRMCRRWPFIDSLNKDIHNWRIMASVCPGMRTDADVHELLEFVCKKLGQNNAPTCKQTPEPHK
jgi:Fe-S-cluster containining protein